MSLTPQKIRILKFIAEQGIVTIDDINLGLFPKDKSASIRVILHQMGRQPIPSLGDIKHGVLAYRGSPAG